jgi:NADPH-dependent F420 reductase
MTDTIAILGTGRMGSGLMHAFASIGRRVALGSREPARAQAVVDQIQADLLDADLIPGDYREVIEMSQIVILAVPFAEGARVLTELAEDLAGKLVVDITNPFGAAPPDISGAELHARLLPPTTTLVAAWKTNFSTLLTQQARANEVHDCFLCGDDEESKHRVARLAAETGLRPVDCGRLSNARVLDAMVPLMLELDSRYRCNHRSSWKFAP